MFYRLFLRPLLFLMPAERAHKFTLTLLKISLRIPIFGALLKRTYSPGKRAKGIERMGLKFKNRVGLAAGFDKDGKAFRDLASLGFGFVEIGTVTPEPQIGNPTPRLFRLPKDQAVINRMGFNNEGAKALWGRLVKGRPKNLILGGNIGKNKTTPNENAVEDYLRCMTTLHSLVDYFTVNMSSPNTPNLRELQDKEPLRIILQTLVDFNQSTPHPKPILLKIAPDLSEGQLDDIAEIVKELNLAGVVATNTTISREGLRTPEKVVTSIGNGGLSGAPLKKVSPHIVAHMRKKLGKDFTIIGVGGIMTAGDAQRMFEAGADLVQIYTGLIYRGPSLISEIADLD